MRLLLLTCRCSSKIIFNYEETKFKEDREEDSILVPLMPYPTEMKRESHIGVKHR